MTNFEDVGAFHARFGLPVRSNGSIPHELDSETSDFRVKTMQEELDEYKQAVEEGDLAGQFDALLDLVYFAMGTAHTQGFPWEVGWTEVQRANITKVRASQDGSDSKRGSGLDVVKPEGWKAPRIETILESYGYRQLQTGC